MRVCHAMQSLGYGMVTALSASTITCVRTQQPKSHSLYCMCGGLGEKTQEIGTGKWVGLKIWLSGKEHWLQSPAHTVGVGVSMLEWI